MKISKTGGLVAPDVRFWGQNCTKFDFRWGSAPTPQTPLGGELTALPRPHSCIWRDLLLKAGRGWLDICHGYAVPTPILIRAWGPQVLQVAGHNGCRMESIRFLARWLKRRLNQALISFGLVYKYVSSFRASLFRCWIGLCSVLRPRQHSIGYMGDGFYRSKDPTNSIKVLKEEATKENLENGNNKIHT